MRSRLFIVMMLAAIAMTMRTHAEAVDACTSALAEIFSETHDGSSDQTPPTFEKKKDAFLSVYRAATDGLTIEELHGLVREPFDFVNFVDATNLARAHEKLMQLKKLLPSFSIKERDDVMTAIQTLLADKVSQTQTSKKSWNEKREEETETHVAQILRGHTRFVASVAFSPDGNHVASGSSDSTVRIWSLNSRGDTIILKGHATLVTAVAFSPDGKFLASGSEDKTIRLWNLNEPTATPLILEVDTKWAWVRCVAFSPDGHTLASGYRDGMIRLWDMTLPKPALKNQWKAHMGSVQSVAFSPDGNSLASGSVDTNIVLSNLNDPIGNQITRLGHFSWVNAIAFSPDGKSIASAGYDNSVQMWILPNPQADQIVLRRDLNNVRSVAFSPDGRFIASSGETGFIYITDLTDPKNRSIEIRGHRSSPTPSVTSMAFSPDGNLLISGSDDGTVGIWKWRRILGLAPDRLEEDVR